MVELVMGYPNEEYPPRPRYPLEFTLFEDKYPDLSDVSVKKAMDAMDSGYLNQGYYEKQKAKIKIDDAAKKDVFTYDTYSWTEHISRKWGQWAASPDTMLKALQERGFSFEKSDSR
jgi:hypothetical protein